MPDPDMNPWRVAIVGLGSIGSYYREILAELPGMWLTAIVEPDSARVERAGRSGPRVFRNLAELAASGVEVEAAIVCSPPSLHYPGVRSLLASGTHVLVEKPLATAARHAWEITSLAGAAGKVVATAGKFRWVEGLRRARAAIERGEIGRLVSVENTFSQRLIGSLGWRSEPTLSGGGVWMDNGPHSLDVVESVAGPVRKIRMVERTRASRSEPETEVLVRCRHDDGVVSTINLSWERQITAPIARCVGTDGEIVVGWGEATLRRHGGSRVLAPGYDKKRAFVSVVMDFRRRCADGIAKDHGARAVALIEAAYRSFKLDRWTEAGDDPKRIGDRRAAGLQRSASDRAST